MLDELKDGHVNLSSSFNTSYYRRWWSDYPQDFNFRTLQQYYLGFDYPDHFRHNIQETFRQGGIYVLSLFLFGNLVDKP